MSGNGNTLSKKEYIDSVERYAVFLYCAIFLSLTALYYMLCVIATYPMVYVLFPSYDKTTGCPYTDPHCKNNGCYEGHYTMCFVYALVPAGSIIALVIAMTVAIPIIRNKCVSNSVEYTELIDTPDQTAITIQSDSANQTDTYIQMATV